MDECWRGSPKYRILHRTKFVQGSAGSAFNIELGSNGNKRGCFSSNKTLLDTLMPVTKREA